MYNGGFYFLLRIRMILYCNIFIVPNIFEALTLYLLISQAEMVSYCRAIKDFVR